MPTTSQRAILGAAGGLNALLTGKIGALHERQQRLLQERQFQQEAEKIDVNKLFAEAQMLNAQTQQDRLEQAKANPMVQLQEMIARPLVEKINTVGLGRLSEEELRMAYGLAGVSLPNAEIPEAKDLSDAISYVTTGKWDDERFVKYMQLQEATGDSPRGRVFKYLLDNTPKTRKERVLAKDYGGVKEYTDTDVEIPLSERVEKVQKIMDEKFETGEIFDPTRVDDALEVLNGDYDPNVDTMLKKALEALDSLEREIFSDPVVNQYLEGQRAKAGGSE